VNVTSDLSVTAMVARSEGEELPDIRSRGTPAAEAA